MDFKMKKTKTILASLALSVVLTACATTQSAGNTASAESTPKQEKTKKTVEEPEETLEDKFIKSLNNITIQTVSSPKEVTKGKAFAAPFVFNVKKDGQPLPDFPVTLSYPESKSADGITYAKSDLTTDENGNITFSAETTTFATKAKVSVYPAPVSDSAELIERLKPFTAEADWKVKSNLSTKGAVLFIWDFNEKDRPVNNSSAIQAEFRTRGITMVGNGPINDTSYIGKLKALYKDTYNTIGTAYGYLIYGTVKFAQPVTALEDGSGYTCTLKSEIIGVDMKNGAQIYSSEMTYESKGKNYNECVLKGKDKLAELIVNDIVYGL